MQFLDWLNASYDLLHCESNDVLTGLVDLGSEAYSVPQYQLRRIFTINSSRIENVEMYLIITILFMVMIDILLYNPKSPICQFPRSLSD